MRARSRTGTWRRRSWSWAATLALGALALTGAGCGGDSGPAVASLGGSAKTTSDAPPGSASSGAQSSSSAGGSGARSVHMVIGAGRNATAFSACMRRHGLPKFPDPDSQGGISVDSSSGIDPGSPTFRTAQRACRALLPHGGPLSPAEQARMQAQALKFSACMRAHGVPKFPDPSFSAGHMQLRLRSASGLDPRSATFQAAQRACQGQLPGTPGPPGSPKAR